VNFSNWFRRGEPAVATPAATGGWRKRLARIKSSSSVSKINYAVVTAHPNYAMVGLVFGISWHQHLARDAVAIAATSAATQSGGNHIFYRQKASSVSTYGVARVASEDKKRYPRLVPAAIVFAASIKDKDTSTILLLDLRDAQGNGSLFMCMALRGDPVPDREFIGSESECIEMLRKWTNATASGVHLLLDLHPGALRTSLQASHPNNDEYNLTDQVIGRQLDLKPVSLMPFKKWHLGFIASIVLVWVAAQYGADFYKQKIEKDRAAAANHEMMDAYIRDRDSFYQQGYTASWSEGFAGAYSTIAGERFIRKGWRFEQAICTVAERKCRLGWVREYGTYISFLDGLDPQQFEIDASDYRKGVETRTWAERTTTRPAYMDLPVDRVFIKQDGDRKDTLLLSGFLKYDTSPMAPLLGWAGQGIPPGPEVVTAPWSVEGGLDLMLELNQSTHLSPEFAAKTVTFTNAEGQLIVRIEGNIYARKS